MVFARLSALVAAVAMATSVAASTHQIQLVNNCGSDTTMQLPGIGNYGAGTYSFNGDVNGGIAQACSDINGQGCTSVEFTLVDGVSSADITLISPHVFDHPAQFNMNNNQVSASCQNANCGPDEAFYTSTDYSAQRQVNGPGSSIYIQFC